MGWRVGGVRVRIKIPLCTISFVFSFIHPTHLPPPPYSLSMVIGTTPHHLWFVSLQPARSLWLRGQCSDLITQRLWIRNRRQGCSSPLAPGLYHHLQEWSNHNHNSHPPKITETMLAGWLWAENPINSYTYNNEFLQMT